MYLLRRYVRTTAADVIQDIITLCTGNQTAFLVPFFRPATISRRVISARAACVRTNERTSTVYVPTYVAAVPDVIC